MQARQPLRLIPGGPVGIAIIPEWNMFLEWGLFKKGLHGLPRRLCLLNLLDTGFCVCLMGLFLHQSNYLSFIKTIITDTDKHEKKYLKELH